MREDLKISGFKTPEKYFDNFEAELFSRIEEEKLPKSAGFQVPTGYFDNLEEMIIAKETASRKPNKVIPLFTKRYIGYAAAIAASLMIGVAIFNSNQSKTTLDTIQLSLIDKYIDEGNLNMDLYDLTSYLEPHDIQIVDFENQHFSQTTLESYLLENTDVEVLMDE